MGKKLGIKVTRLLTEQKITQKELAKTIGVSEAVISRYISGEREPKLDIICNIATYLRTTSDFLLGIETDEFDYPRVKRMIARNSENMTNLEKKELINALFGEE